MASSADISVWDLWAEAAKESESLGDPVFLECLEAVTSSRFFVDLPDDKLKSSLSIINTLLNDPKTRSKGLTLLSEFLTQSNPSRLITFQDSIISALHLVVKGLESPLASNVLVCFIPKCHSMTEVNQCMTSSIIPKILAHFCENSQDSNTQKSVEELTLLRVCLEEYHGPCGQFRDKLEKVLVPLVDSDNGILLNFLGDVMPLLSYAGGGGGGGEKHTKDWSDMLTKVLKTTYSTLYALYGSSCPLLEQENPFDGEQLTGLKRIAEPQVLLRMALLKRRLHRLLIIISAYLRMPFPAPKLVPQKGILKLITILTALNPVTTQNVRRKEDIFLSAAIPAIHSASMDVLKSLLLCVGTNIYIDAVSVEHLLTSEFKWIQERPAAYVDFKLQLYRTLASWLVTTGGVVTNLKTMSAWVDVIGNDTRVEKDVVELKILSKPKSGKSVKLMNSSSLPLGATTSLTFVQKNADVCKLALISLTLLIPSLDGPNHRKIYEHLVRTCAVINQFQTPPSPYDNAYCRKLIYENLSFVTKNPHPRSPITLSLIVSLFRKGMQDPTALVSSFCSAQLSAIERLMHPISAPLSLAGPSAVPVALDNSNINTVNIANSIASASEGSEDEEENDQIENDKEMQIENQSHTEQSNSAGVPLLVYPDQLKQIVRDVFLESLTNGVPINVSQTPKRTPPTYSVTSDRSSGARSTFSGNNNKAAKVLTSTSPSAPSYDSDVVEVNDDSSVEAIEPSQGFITNGIRHPENELISNQTEVDDNCKRKLADDGSEYESMSNGDTQFKKTKTSSPLKSATPLEGPSVDEMLSSFIDLEPAS